MAWDVFGKGNGCGSFQELQTMILQYKKDQTNSNPTIECMVLTNPIFFKQEDWIAIPEDGSNTIVSGKSYTTETIIGAGLWSKVDRLLESYNVERIQKLRNVVHLSLSL